MEVERTECSLTIDEENVHAISFVTSRRREWLVEDDAGGVGRSYDTVTAILPAARGLHYAQALEGGNSANCTYAATASLQAVLRM